MGLCKAADARGDANAAAGPDQMGNEARGVLQMIDKRSQALCSVRDGKTRQYKRLYYCCFIVFLVANLIDRILPRQWRFRDSESAHRMSVVEEAKEQASMFVPYLFMKF